MRIHCPVQRAGSEDRRRGSILVLAAFLLVVVFAMVAFAVDVGYIVHVDTELQRTADASALAAVQHLPDQAAATTAAQFVAQQNKGATGPDLTASDIQFGIWERDTATFTPTTNEPNAVKVTVARSQDNGNPLKLFFAPIIGTSHTNVTASAIAMYDNNLCGPLIGIDWIDMKGTPRTDSYRSSLGSYSSQSPRDNGDICSDGPISVVGNAIVNGDANPGRGHTTTITGNAVVTGNTTPRSRPLNLPAVDTHEVSQTNDNDAIKDPGKGPPGKGPPGKGPGSPLDSDRNFTLTGTTKCYIPPGDYYFNNMTLTGQSELRLEEDGKVRIYLTGDLQTAGGKLANSTGVPDNLQVLMTGGKATITGNIDMHAVIYAPNTEVTVTGTGALFGAVVGKTLDMSGTGDIHYDEDLNLGDTLNLPKRITLVK